MAASQSDALVLFGEGRSRPQDAWQLGTERGRRPNRRRRQLAQSLTQASVRMRRHYPAY